MTRCLSALIAVVLLAWQAHGQAMADPPSFEVAAIKKADPRSPFRKGGFLPGGRIDLPGATLKMLVMLAYGVQENLIQGLPKWGDSERFDIVAKAAPDTPVPMLRRMVEALLVERFKLAIHREDKVMAAYVLTLGKRPLKLTEGAGPQQGCNWVVLEAGLRRRECHKLTMAEFANALPGWGGVGVDLPVLDQTGLKGAYDFQLTIGFAFKKGEGGGGGDARAIPEDTGPTIFTALEQIGLKLESHKTPLSLVMIDHAEMPTEN